jgi:glycosyltransferase involved in cell wall biosynthesis
MPFDAYWNQHRSDPAKARFGEKTATRAAFATLRAFGRTALHRADAVWRQPESLPEAATRALRLARDTRFVPNPVEIPQAPIQKAPRPLVLFLGRLDWQKQPARFFALARRLPEIAFVAAGVATDPADDAQWRIAARDIPNLALAGHVQDGEKEALLREAWIVCNTSLREGLPHSLQEGLAHGCALVARVDPDGLVSRFGVRVAQDDFEAAVSRLLDRDEWQHRGAQGRAFVQKQHAAEAVLDLHESLYQELAT